MDCMLPCMCIHRHTHAHTRTYAHTCMRMHTCIHAHTHSHHTHTCTHTHTQTHTHTHTHYTHTCTRTHAHTQRHTDTHTHTHTHTPGNRVMQVTMAVSPITILCDKAYATTFGPLHAQYCTPLTLCCTAPPPPPPLPPPPPPPSPSPSPSPAAIQYKRYHHLRQFQPAGVLYAGWVHGDMDPTACHATGHQWQPLWDIQGGWGLGWAGLVVNTEEHSLE